MNTFTRLSLLALLAWASIATVSGEVTWRVSVKLFLGPAGERPGTPALTDADIQAQFDFANTNPFLAARGLKLEKSEVIEIVSPQNAPKNWFTVDLTANDNNVLLETEAEANPAAYQWRDDKINIYVNDGTPGGSGRFPGDGEIIVIGADKTQSTPWVFIHEIGHHMSVKHTHQGQNCTDDDTSDCDDCPNPKGGNADGMADTLSDHKCFDQDGIAQESFGKNYNPLTATQKEEVDNTFFNIMSYHGNRSVFTTLQLDAMCDTSNDQRDAETHNNFIFVDILSAGILPTGQSKLQPIGGPYKNLKNAIDDADTGDVLLLRPGTHTEERVIRKAITLRAVRRDMLVDANATLRAR